MSDRLKFEENSGEGNWAEERLNFKFSPGFFKNFERYLTMSGRSETLDQIRQGGLVSGGLMPDVALDLISDLVAEDAANSRHLGGKDTEGVLAEGRILGELKSSYKEYLAFMERRDNREWVNNVVDIFSKCVVNIREEIHDLNLDVVVPVEDKLRDHNFSEEVQSEKRRDIVAPVRHAVLTLESLAHNLMYERDRIIDLWRFGVNIPSDIKGMVDKLREDSPIFLSAFSAAKNGRDRIYRELKALENK